MLCYITEHFPISYCFLLVKYSKFDQQSIIRYLSCILKNRSISIIHPVYVYKNMDGTTRIPDCVVILSLHARITCIFHNC